MSIAQLNPFDNVDFEYEEDENGQPIVCVDDQHQAEAHLRALSNWRGQAEQIEEHAKYQIERVNAWRDEELAKIQKSITYHETGLIAFLQMQGKKTIKLINGTIKRIAGRNRIDVLDFDTLNKWNEKEQAGVIRTKLEPDKKAIMNHIKISGEIPNGVDMVTGEDSFKIETK